MIQCGSSITNNAPRAGPNLPYWGPSVSLTAGLSFDHLVLLSGLQGDQVHAAVAAVVAGVEPGAPAGVRRLPREQVVVAVEVHVLRT